MSALYRRTDPASSKDAAKRHTRSGRLFGQRRRIYDALVDGHDGATASELGAQVGLTNVQVCRRLPELAAGGFVRRGEAKRSAITDRMESTWWLVPEGPEQLSLLEQGAS